jgi:hypothetical protein
VKDVYQQKKLRTSIFSVFAWILFRFIHELCCVEMLAFNNKVHVFQGLAVNAWTNVTSLKGGSKLVWCDISSLLACMNFCASLFLIFTFLGLTWEFPTHCVRSQFVICSPKLASNFLELWIVCEGFCSFFVSL